MINVRNAIDKSISVCGSNNVGFLGQIYSRRKLMGVWGRSPRRWAFYSFFFKKKYAFLGIFGLICLKPCC